MQAGCDKWYDIIVELCRGSESSRKRSDIYKKCDIYTVRKAD